MALDRGYVLDALRERLSERSFEHSVRVAEAAERLAASYGVDTTKAWFAGLLHDWDRDVARDTLPSRAREAGIPVGETDELAPHLLHARTAAAEVAARFPELPIDVIDAIARHTVGATEMSDLDMVVYIADSIEPGRDWPGVQRLREVAGTLHLDELLMLTYQESLSHLVEARKIIHPDTAAVWNALVTKACR